MSGRRGERKRPPPGVSEKTETENNNDSSSSSSKKEKTTVSERWRGLRLAGSRDRISEDLRATLIANSVEIASDSEHAENDSSSSSKIKKKTGSKRKMPSMPPEIKTKKNKKTGSKRMTRSSSKDPAPETKKQKTGARAAAAVAKPAAPKKRVTFLSLEASAATTKNSEESNSNENLARDQFCMLRGFFVSLDWRKPSNAPKLHDKVKTTIAICPDVTRIVTHDGKCLLALLLESIDLSYDRRSVIEESFIKTAKVVIEANPWALLQSIAGGPSYPGSSSRTTRDKKIIEDLAEYNDWSQLLFPWIGQTFPWLFGLKELKQNTADSSHMLPSLALARYCADNSTIQRFFEAVPEALKHKDRNGLYPLHHLLQGTGSVASRLGAKSDVISWMVRQYPAVLGKKSKKTTTSGSTPTPFSIAMATLLNFCSEINSRYAANVISTASMEQLQSVVKVCRTLLCSERHVLAEARSWLQGHRLNSHCNLEPIQTLALEMLRYCYPNPRTRVSAASVEEYRRSYPFIPRMVPLIAREAAIIEERVSIQRTALMLNKGAAASSSSSSTSSVLSVQEKFLQDVTESYKRWSTERLLPKASETKRVKDLRTEMATIQSECEERQQGAAGRRPFFNDDDDDHDSDGDDYFNFHPLLMPMGRMIMNRIMMNHPMFGGYGSDDDDADY